MPGAALGILRAHAIALVTALAVVDALAVKGRTVASGSSRLDTGAPPMAQWSVGGLGIALGGNDPHQIRGTA